MRSVTESKSGLKPFVYAVDVTLGETSQLGYAGYFKVAISSLLTKFYPALDACIQTSELEPAAGGTWQSEDGADNAGNEWDSIEASLKSYK